MRFSIGSASLVILSLLHQASILHRVDGVWSNVATPCLKLVAGSLTGQAEYIKNMDGTEFCSDDDAELVAARTVLDCHGRFGTDVANYDPTQPLLAAAPGVAAAPKA